MKPDIIKPYYLIYSNYLLPQEADKKGKIHLASCRSVVRSLMHITSLIYLTLK